MNFYKVGFKLNFKLLTDFKAIMRSFVSNNKNHNNAVLPSSSFAYLGAYFK